MTKWIVLGLLLIVGLALGIWLALNPQARAAVEPYLQRAGEVLRPIQTAVRSMLDGIRPTTNAFSDLMGTLQGMGEGLRSLWMSMMASFTPSH